MQEIRRWDKNTNENKLKRAKRDELVTMLYQAIGAVPHRRSQAKRYHRFGLSFMYMGGLPAPLYREGMSSEELRAMLELYPNPKISAAQLKALLKDYGSKLTGGKGDLLERLRSNLYCKNIYADTCRLYSYEECWEDEQASLQAKFDEERNQWQAQVESHKGNSTLYKKAQADGKALQDKETAIKKKRELEASNRPWCAKPYDSKFTSKAALEAEWRRAHPRLSFPYSGAKLPTPEDFSDVLTD